MENPFKLLVFAIIVVALLALFFFYFAPLYLWKEEPTEAVKTQLEIAETQLGHYASQDAVFSSGYTVQATGFESPHRSIVFECNSEIYCCEEGKDCEKAIEWDNAGKRRYFSFKETKGVKVSARCRYEDIYICKVFIGKEPAQVKIQSLELEPQELDLSKENSLRANFEVENTGEKGMIAVEAIARLYKKQVNRHGELERVLKKESSKEFSLGVGEEYKGELEIEIGENGEYEVEIIVREKTDGTNYEKQSFEVKAFGMVETETCAVGEMQIQELEKCVYLLPCKCKGIVECEKTWRNRLNIPIEEEFEIVSVDEEEEEIVLKYTAEYEIPEWCDSETMNCEEYCKYQELPEPECTLSPCRDDLDNCRVWLPCECEEGADFQKCIDAWNAKIGERNFKTGILNGKKAVYIEGQWRQGIQEICDRCGGKIKRVVNYCLLPKVNGCGGNSPPQIIQPATQTQPKPEAQKPCKPKALFWDKQEIKTAGYETNVCYVVFVCECASFEECANLWKPRISPEPRFEHYSYNGKDVPALKGTGCDPECDECYHIVPCTGCKYSYTIDDRYIE